MIREFCDRCGKDVTGQVSGAIQGVADADRDGNGEVAHEFTVVCRACYRAWRAWMTKTPKTPRRRVRA